MCRESSQEGTCLVAEEAATRGKDAEGMATVKDIRRVGVEALRDKKDEEALAGREEIVRVQINNMV